jgi:hypothetical protein
VFKDRSLSRTDFEIHVQQCCASRHPSAATEKLFRGFTLFPYSARGTHANVTRVTPQICWSEDTCRKNGTQYSKNTRSGLSDRLQVETIGICY